MKKLLSLIMAVSFLLSMVSTAFAYRIKEPPYELRDKGVNKLSYKFYEDFSSVKPGNRPETINTISLSANTELSVVEAEDYEGRISKQLFLNDKNASGNMNFNVPIPQKGKTILLEIRFKYKKTQDDFMSFGFDLYSGKQTIGRIIQWTSGGSMVAYSTSGTNTAITPATPVSDEWYTLQVRMDRETNAFDVQLQSDSMKDASYKGGARFDPVNGVAMLKGISYPEEASGANLTHINIRTTAKRGELYIDWIRAREGVSELEYKGVKIKSLELPLKITPVLSPVSDIINVDFKGEYLYFTGKPYAENNDVMIPLLSLSSAYGFTVSVEDKKVIMKKEAATAEINLSDGEIRVDGKVLSLKAKTTGRITYIPALAFCEAMGDNAVFENNEVKIRGKE